MWWLDATWLRVVANSTFWSWVIRASVRLPLMCQLSGKGKRQGRTRKLHLYFRTSFHEAKCCDISKEVVYNKWGKQGIKCPIVNSIMSINVRNSCSTTLSKQYSACQDVHQTCSSFNLAQGDLCFSSCIYCFLHLFQCCSWIVIQ